MSQECSQTGENAVDPAAYELIAFIRRSSLDTRRLKGWERQFLSEYELGSSGDAQTTTPRPREAPGAPVAH